LNAKLAIKDGYSVKLITQFWEREVIWSWKILIIFVLSVERKLI
jgi:hypothetical protein